MILEVHSTDIETGKAVAKLIVERINTFAPTMNRKFVIGLPTGNTPIPVYRELIAMCRNQEVSFEFVVTISLDEWLGLAADHPSSNACYMERELIPQVDLPPAQTHLLAGVTPDPDYECARFEALISAHGGIHLLLCGIGGNGHLGLNEPGSGLNSRTRIVNLSPETRSSRAIDFGGLEQVPTHALTIGTGTICQAAEIILLATGDAKARSVRDSLQGPITHLCPASVLQLHPDVKVFTDVPAAELIDEKTREYLTPLPPPQPVEPALYSPSQIISRPTSPFALPVALTKSDLISPHSTTNIDFSAKVIKRRPGLRLITTQLPLFKRTSTDARAKGSRRRGSIGAGMLVVKEGDDDEDDEGPGWRR